MVSWQEKKKKKKEQEENSRFTDWSAWSLRGPGPLLSVDPRKKNYDKAREANSKSTLRMVQL